MPVASVACDKQLQVPAKGPSAVRTPATATSPLSQARKSPSSRTSSGYPSRGASAASGKRVDMEEFNKQLEKIKAETRMLKSKEAQLRANMSREETGKHGQHHVDEEKEIMDWRQEQSKLMQKAEAERKREQRERELKESRQFQEDKRLARQVAQQEQLKLASSSYATSKEIAELDEAMKRAQIIEQRNGSESNHETYRTFNEYELMEKAREKEEERILQQSQQQSEMEEAVASVLKEQELATQEIEKLKNIAKTGKVPTPRLRTGAAK